MGESRQQRKKLYEKLVGEEVAGRFVITDLLGFGGMGAVYRAVQQNMQRDVALKVIPSHDPTTAARFKREALTISQLHHPNTVTVFDYGEAEDGLLFLAMEMLDGETLSERLARTGPLDPQRVVHITDQVCRSLKEAHDSDIVHRDIKPDNIFLIAVDDDPDFVKVLDFGIAKIVRGEDNVDLTGTGRIIGTPKYMSPEQILGEELDARSDLYSLGCIVFEMLCGRPPFEDSTTTKLMLAHAHKAPPTFAERLPPHALERIPGPLEQVVRRALSKAPGERQRDIEEFRHALEVALDGTDAPQTPVGERSDVPAQPARAEEQSGATDSSDLLSQHSSQTLAKLDKPSTGDRPAPEPQSRPATSPTDSTDEETDGSGTWKLVAVAAVLLLAAGGAYLIFIDGDGASEAADEQEAAEAAAQDDDTRDEESKDDPTGSADDEGDDPDPVEVQVTTEPDGANVFDEGRLVGKTPMTAERRPGETLEYRFEREGYRDEEASFEVEEDGELFMVALDAEKEESDEEPAAKQKPAAERPSSPTPSRQESESASAAEDDSAESEDSSGGDSEEPDEEEESEAASDEDEEDSESDGAAVDLVGDDGSESDEEDSKPGVDRLD
ncbi:MAG: protein kinase domain-containing protein [Persicimonas sp.]